MFNSTHYVPILKWKRAEQGALSNLEDKDKKYITPLIQFVMPNLSEKEKAGKTQEEEYEAVILKFKKRVPKLSDEILKFWGKETVFVDFSMLYTLDLKSEALKAIILQADSFNLPIIPVLNLSDELILQKLVSSSKNGLCLRLVCADLADLSLLENKIKDFILVTEISLSNIDLLVDVKEIDEEGDKFSDYIKISQSIPYLEEWRTFTYASGGFPVDLSACSIDDENIIPRFDWNNWYQFFKENKLKRVPSFSDYTIQYPIYNESANFFHPTTSIKYTLDTDWFIFKGKKQKYDLYLANAKLLIGDGRFYGEGFSYGDKYIYEKGKHYDTYIKDPEVKGTGSTETWLQAGINHHLVCTSTQVSKLFLNKEIL